ncbi:two-component sensor histidine kinase [Williamsia phyllosphaerae]|uniref:histidine kinase n=1 Tax=Williamsia phyllosphaerae TaxID=885042 RepID=A0ABQ1V501_9NOCA|nr:two-component sensor histidine kinase [Williamsia phyllosphaerae]
MIGVRRRRRSPSLRTRVTVAAALVTVIIVGLVGAVAWTQVRTSGYRELDARVDTLSAAMQPSLSNPNSTTIADNVASGSLATTRVGALALFSTPTQIPQQDVGIRDTTINNTKYRVKTVSVLDSSILNGGANISVAVPLKPTLDRIDGLRRGLLLIGLAAVVASAVLAWLLGGLAIRPLRRLAKHTEALPVDAGPADPERAALHTVRGAREAEEIAAAMNSLLGRVDDERARTQEALTTARDFASVSAHELRTPLTAMRTDLEVLDTFSPDAASRAEIITDLRRSHGRILETLASLENLAQGELGGRDRVRMDVVDILDRVATESAARLHGVTISLDGDQSVPAAVVETGIAMAVQNAVINAVRHGQATEIRLSAHPLDAHGGAVIWVDDNGRGIPPADRARLFGRFERGTTTASGSGLGLALIAQQATLHRGTAELSDSPLGGTRLAIGIDTPT